MPFIYPPEDRIKLWKTQVELLDLLCPDGDYLFWAQFGESSCGYLFDVYNARQDYEEAWRWLERGADFAIHFDTYDFEAPHSSPILCGYVSGGWIMKESGYHSKNLLNWLKKQRRSECPALRCPYSSSVTLCSFRRRPLRTSVANTVCPSSSQPLY